MFKKRTIIAASVFTVPLVATTIGLGVVAQSQATCGITQDEIVSLIGSSLAPGSNTLVASPEQLGNAAAGFAGTTPECGIDAVVALGTIRPDAADAVAQAVAAALPGQQDELLAAAEGIGQPIAPGAGYEGPYDAPFDDDDEDDEDDDDDFDDDDDDGASPT